MLSLPPCLLGPKGGEVRKEQQNGQKIVKEIMKITKNAEDI